MAENGTFALRLERVQDYEFKVIFDQEQLAPLIVDEPPPLGHSRGPNPARLLGAAVGNCLSASLLFCLQKAKIEVKNIKTTVNGTLVRNEKGRLRIGKLAVHLMVEVAEEQQRLLRCLELFEDFCVVTAGVRGGIPIAVVVSNALGEELYRAAGEPVAGGT
ncbi:MAG: OsmC family protein [candidate division KSB1 bacterium]|nr:OsmC family protein [candidate division KSB1 bacterium]MDZ7274200.1 OsmC family protein [candidate division KSB1 bacterium]MDZ7287278.1 OsmC family protein [candidate division KSB1 bacterium]MDZ7296798.1 OsmC family protein [candidate division KSB1 bacterium]MDZ7308449.1 OsmC family protein [candidate division KSB1 bacterium]